MDNLNKEQKEAVVNTEGRIRVTAGAGSGKTMTLACRYAYLVNEVGIDASSILCLTFTNKAANEMKSRVKKIMGKSLEGDWICTIHSFCVKLLRKEIYRIGYPRNFTIIDTSDSEQIARSIMKELHLTHKDTTVREIIKNVEKYKARRNDEYIEKYVISNNLHDSTNVPVTMFIQKQRYCFALDFIDLILFTLYILTHYKEARLFWSNAFDYIMIDEAQDCSTTQWAVLYILSEVSKNLFIVGDPDQCIYEWRGAKPELFVNFEADKDVVLGKNYRSTPQILDVANSIISNNKNRIPKDLIAIKEEGIKPTHYHAVDNQDEAQFIAETITCKCKTYKLDDFAILYRNSHYSRRIEQEFLRKEIPYTVWGGVRFLERKEIKECLAYLQLIQNKDNDIAFQRVINMPRRGFGDKRVELLLELQKNKGMSLYETLCRNTQLFSSCKIDEFIKTINASSAFSEDHSILETLNYVLEKSGLQDMYFSEGDEERIEALSEFSNMIREYEKTQEDKSLEDFLQEIALLTNVDTNDTKERVKLMTIHQAKGLEFPCVFICGLNEGVFPSEMALKERRTEEERRLMYVACTRAKEELFMTEVGGYDHYRHESNTPSRFLFEFPYDMILSKGKYVKWDITFDMNKDNPAITDVIKESKYIININANQEVIHKTFGKGRVLFVQNEYVLVQFKVGKRKCKPDFLKNTDIELVKERELCISAIQDEEEKKLREAYPEGMRVRHKIFGEGIVVSVDRYRVEVQFSVGKRKVQPQYLKATEVSNNKLQS